MFTLPHLRRIEHAGRRNAVAREHGARWYFSDHERIHCGTHGQRIHIQPIRMYQHEQRVAAGVRGIDEDERTNSGHPRVEVPVIFIILGDGHTVPNTIPRCASCTALIDQQGLIACTEEQRVDGERGVANEDADRIDAAVGCEVQQLIPSITCLHRIIGA